MDGRVSELACSKTGLNAEFFIYLFIFHNGWSPCSPSSSEAPTLRSITMSHSKSRIKLNQGCQKRIIIFLDVINFVAIFFTGMYLPWLWWIKLHCDRTIIYQINLHEFKNEATVIGRVPHEVSQFLCHNWPSSLLQKHRLHKLR